MSSLRVIAISMVGSLTLFSAACSKTEPTTDAKASYVSDEEQYVESLHQEVAIDNPDALLADLNDSVGDNSENAERVRLNATEQPADPSLTTTDPTTPATE